MVNISFLDPTISRETHGSSEQAGQLDGSPLQTALAASMSRAAPVTAGGSMAQTSGFFDFCCEPEPVPLRRSLSGTAGSYIVSAAYGSSSAAVARRSTCCTDAEDAEVLLLLPERDVAVAAGV